MHPKRPLNLITFFLITSIIFIFTMIFSPSVLAQVFSGSVSLMDIVLDSGGGARKSGSVTLKNTSIGNSVGGSFVTSGGTTLCSGHACKADYDFDNYPQLSIVIKAGPDAKTSGPYKVSGLRSDESGDAKGDNYYNSLVIAPGVTTSNPDAISVVGVAFTPENFTVDNRTFVPTAQLIRGVNSNNGFVLIYAQHDSSIPYFDATGVLRTFTASADNYYVYFNNSWSSPLDKVSRDFSQFRLNNATVLEARIDPLSNSPPQNPAFNLRMYSGLGSRKWATFGILSTSDSNIAGKIEKQEPTDGSAVRGPSATSISTFYMFSILD